MAEHREHLELLLGIRRWTRRNRAKEGQFTGFQRLGGVVIRTAADQNPLGHVQRHGQGINGSLSRPT